MKRWSRLQREIEQLFARDLDLRIQCRVYRMASQSGSTDLPRYWMTLGREVIWDYPRDAAQRSLYPHVTEISDISRLIRSYIDTPLAQLLEAGSDPWGLSEILLAADRRIGRRSRDRLRQRLQHPGALAVLNARQRPRGAEVSAHDAGRSDEHAS